MRWLWVENEYKGFVQIDDENKIIVKIKCLCPSFSGFVYDKEGNFVRSIKSKVYSVGKLFDKKYLAEPCKHLKPIVEALQKQGYKMKEVNSGEGLDKLTPKLRAQILKVWGDECFIEGCGEKNVEIHRLIPKTSGGKYSLINCRPLCRQHHQEVTYQPWHK